MYFHFCHDDYLPRLKFCFYKKQSIFDVLPTTLHLMGIPAPDGLEGETINFQHRDTDEKMSKGALS
jgi:hypothetical protein